MRARSDSLRNRFALAPLAELLYLCGRLKTCKRMAKTLHTIIRQSQQSLLSALKERERKVTKEGSRNGASGKKNTATKKEKE